MDSTNNTILLGEYGSRAYGTNTVDSDRDLVEVVVEPRKYITGLFDWDTKMQSTAEIGARSTAVDTDKTVYGLKKFADLAVAGNPSVLAILFLGEYEVLTDLGSVLVDNRSSFVSKSAGRRFLGYMTSQRDAMTGARNKRTNRPELVHKFGYDTKFAYHMIRLGLLGKELMETGSIQLPMNKDFVGICMDIRAGKMSKDEVLAESYALEASLEKAIDKSDLPDRGDRETVSSLLDIIYGSAWSRTDD